MARREKHTISVAAGQSVAREASPADGAGWLRENILVIDRGFPVLLCLSRACPGKC